MMDVVTCPPPPAADRPTGPAKRTRDRAGSGRDPSADLVADAERLRLASTRLARILRRETHTGLTPTQVAALATLQRRGPVPLGVLAEAERISAPTATKVVDKLARAGLVERRAHPEDRRVSLVAVTPAGHELLTATRRHKTAWLATRLAALDPADRDRLLDAVEVLERLVAPDAPDGPGDQAPPRDREPRL
jgi:DNA-binding MarR family transcriptional regulator